MSTNISFNWIGTWTLYTKEIVRFLKVYNQTLIAPVITSLIFLAIFNLAMGERVEHINNVPFSSFMSAGLIIMAVVQNAFANTSSSMIMAKIMGTISDYVFPPLSPMEVVFAMVMGGVTRGVIVGGLVFLALQPVVSFTFYHPGYLIFHLFASAIFLSLLGLLAGIISEHFDQMAAITGYVITPLSFLSGTFYSIHSLPDFLYQFSLWNPFFYMIDGFRYGLTDHHDGSLQLGLICMTSCVVIMWMVVYLVFSRGWRIKN